MMTFEDCVLQRFSATGFQAENQTHRIRDTFLWFKRSYPKDSAAWYSISGAVEIPAGI